MIRIQNGKKVYNTKGIRTEAIHDISFEIPDGEFVAIMGPSGSGKSTLLNILGGMDVLTEGELSIDGENMAEMKQIEADAFRKERLCFIFQNFALMDAYTVAENVELPLLAQNMKKSERKRIVEEKLAMLGISELAQKRADAISGGQQQRTAIARALAAEADIILADEPTGALDSKNSQTLMEILQEIHEKSRPQKTIVMVTHDRNMAEYADRILCIADGEIVEDIYTEKKIETEKIEKEESVLQAAKTMSAHISQEEMVEEKGKNPEVKKRIPKRVKLAVFLAAFFIVSVAYCMHKTEGEYSEQPPKHIVRIDSAETEVAIATGGGGSMSPCDAMHVHIIGQVAEGEITIWLYENAVTEAERTSEGVPIWRQESYAPVYTETYHAGENIDEWFMLKREKGTIYCDYDFIVTCPTNTDIDATVTRGDYGECYGWQKFLESPWGQWLSKLLGIEIENAR